MRWREAVCSEVEILTLSKHIRSYLLFSRFLLWKLVFHNMENIPISDVFLPGKKKQLSKICSSSSSKVSCSRYSAASSSVGTDSSVIEYAYFEQRLFRKAVWFTFFAVTWITLARRGKWRWTRNFFSWKGARQQRIIILQEKTSMGVKKMTSRQKDKRSVAAALNCRLIGTQIHNGGRGKTTFQGQFFPVCR